jgi:hypothetical protein
MSKASLELGGGNWGTKDGNLLAYAQGNESSNLVPREFTFTRGSDIAATRINSSGLIEKYRENLLLQSNTFDTTWGSATSTLTSGQSGYDGSNDAWKIAKNQANAQINQSYSDTSVKTLSIYAKADTLNWIAIVGASGSIGYFDLLNGVVGTTGGSVIDANIESAGGGWWRCSVSSAATTSSVTIYPADADNDISGTSGSIYIQDAQLERGLVATSYLESGATTVTSGVADNEPRIDYTGGTGSLLLEPSRTNVIKQSEYINGWNFLLNVNVTDNAAISPEGVLNASNIVPTTAASSQKVLDISGFNRTSGQYTSHTIYAKANGYNYLYLSNAADRLFAVYDLSDGSVDYVSSNGTDFINHSASIESVGNGWYRCALIGEAVTSIGSYLRISVAPTSETISAPAYTADGTSGVLVYGVQVEQASYPTSYIPTYGTSVTRNADDCGGAGTSSTFNDTEGVLFIDLETSKNASPAQITINDGTYDNRIIFEVRPDAAFIKALINSSGTNVYDVSVSASPSTAYKVAIKYSANDIAFFVNGVKETSTTTTTAMPTGLSDLSFTGKESDGTLRFIGNVKQTLVFNTALSDRELVDLTSPYSTYQELVTAEGLTWESPTCTTNSITELQSI